MAMLKTALAILARGFLLGLGFVAAVCAVFFAIETGKNAYDSITKVEAKAAQLVISDVEKRVSGDQIFFTGKITNNGKTVAHASGVEVNLFQQGRFVDQYSTHVLSIKLGESRYFKIICDGISQPAEHDSYKVQLRDD